MYTPYSGQALLDSYFEDRKIVISSVSSDTDILVCIEDIKPGKSVNPDFPVSSHAELLKFIRDDMPNLPSIEKLMKRYEIKKVLMWFYDTRIVKGIDCANSEIYALAHYAFLLAYRETKRLPFLNTAMKIGDRLSSLFACELSSCEKNIFAAALVMELNAVQEMDRVSV